MFLVPVYLKGNLFLSIIYYMQFYLNFNYILRRLHFFFQRKLEEIGLNMYILMKIFLRTFLAHLHSGCCFACPLAVYVSSSSSTISSAFTICFLYIYHSGLCNMECQSSFQMHGPDGWGCSLNMSSSSYRSFVFPLFRTACSVN